MSLGITLATSEHFAQEERLMAETGYPLAGRHTRAHATLLARLGAVSDRLAHGHAWHARTMALFAEDFLFRHVDQEDRPLAQHILKRQTPLTRQSPTGMVP